MGSSRLFERSDGALDIMHCTRCGSLVDGQHLTTHSLWHDYQDETVATLNSTIRWVKESFIKLGEVFMGFRSR